MKMVRRSKEIVLSLLLLIGLLIYPGRVAAEVVAVMTFDEYVYEGEGCQFDASCSYDTEGNAIVLYEWDMDGDGFFDDVTGNCITWRFENDGIYEVSLRVTNELGDTDTDAKYVIVENVGPCIDNIEEKYLNAGEVLDLQVTFTDPGWEDTHICHIDWGDGNIENYYPLLHEYHVNASHIWQEPGIYEVLVTVCDDCICVEEIFNANVGETAVMVQKYYSSWGNGRVRIGWELCRDRSSTLSFDIYRSFSEEGPYVYISSPEIIREGNKFTFFDPEAAVGKTFWYKIEIIEDDIVAASFNASVKIPLPEFTLEQNYPNPFNPNTSISFSLSEQGPVLLSVYDVSGRLLNTLVNRDMQPGSYTEVWNGCDQRGDPVAGGVYLYRLSAGGKSITRKMIIIR